ncbi:chloride intracellular channel protein 2-like [Haliotis rubra]|uniref:chloride intracellular channel protein 2-like n=1 Tax=Haliotis rubra TaxID=36100 RepID=UPI001EE6296A|nr:chloride intracellular channel protein 2-like [Haliotis rubra]
MSLDKPLFATTVDDDDRKAVVKQEFKLFIKASQIDKETRGPCPICEHWFMIAYLIAQKQPGVNFSVFTVQENSPPKEFEGWSKKFPVVLSVNCTDKKGQDISGCMYDSFEELETFFENINRECPELKRHNKENGDAMARVDTLYATFNGFLTGQPESKLTKALRALNEDLDNGKRFFIDDMLCYVDCHLLPRLQHIKVATKRYADYNIPKEFIAIWKFLAYAYQQPAFIATMPRDQDIIFHYKKKVTAFPEVKNSTIEKFSYDTYVPEEILEEIRQENFGNEEQEPEPEQQVEEVEANSEMEPQFDNNGLEY